ncbi:MAG: FtsB family cell division protein [Acidimicrobiales bacterium]
MKLSNKSLVVVVVAVLAFAGYVVVFFPLGGILSLNRQLQQARSELASVSKSNERLAAEEAQLKNPRYIEHLARSSYGLVKPGQSEYVIMPGSPLYVPSKSLGGTATTSTVPHS